MIKAIRRQPLFLVVLIMISLLAIGTLGYWFIEEDWSLTESFFMTVITVTTIGYGEVRPLSEMGRLFTIGLILVGVATFTYALSTAVELIISQEFREQIISRRRRKRLAKLKKHTIICGFGRMGSSLAKELINRGSPIVIIDTDKEAIETCFDLDIPTIEGNAANEAVLHEAGITRARALVTVTPSDADNVFIVLTARSINPTLQIISRCHSESSISKLEKAGANHVLSPYKITGQRIAHMITQPNVIQFLDGILEFGDHRMRLEEFIIGENSPVANMTLKEAKLGVAVLAIDHPGKMVATHPNADTKLIPGTAMIAMGRDEDLNRIGNLVRDNV